MSHGRSSVYIIKRRCEALNVSCDHFGRFGTGYHPKRELEDILIENSPHTNVNSLKQRILKEGLLEYKCAICGNTGEW